MIDRLEHFFRRQRRRLSRSEWAIPLLGLPVSEGTSTEPGLVLIQIDGLSRGQMERAMERGRLPFLQSLLQREHYETRTFYPGLPTSTPAVQAELYYGVRGAVPAFSYFERATHRVFTMFTPDYAKEVETRLREHGPGLLQGGSSWSNIYTGGAADEETHFCAAALSARDLFRSRPLLRLVTFPLFHFPSLVRILALLVVELFLAGWDLIHGLARGENLTEELTALSKRVFICIGLRELLTIGTKIDTARGLPIIHVNLLGYDEQAHRRGPSSAFAHWSLLGIDRAIKNIYRAAHRSARRDYQVWIFSDHGQEATQIFSELQPAGLEGVIRAALEGTAQPSAAPPRSGARPAHARLTGERSPGRGFAEWLRTEILARFEDSPFTVAAFGPVGHVYFKAPLSAARKREVAQRLIRAGGVPSVLLCDDDKSPEWWSAAGSIALTPELTKEWPHPEAMRTELVEDLKRLSAHECAGDLILLGWAPDARPLSFANERGAHAGPGTEETQGFILLPEQTHLPAAAKEFLRPADLRAAILHFLGREALPTRPRRPRGAVRQLRVMTYNVHSCLGMDGRISPRRIAGVIRRYHPDVVALQELDLGRVRSQRFDQPKLIAEELGMHLAFCPTVIDQGEQYGHALLSHFPLEVVRTDILRSGRQRAHIEPRGALWVRLEVDGIQLNLMNTHFGLRRSERLAQAEDLLDRDWIGGLSEAEPLILCGDFNMFPRSAPYRALSRRLRDVQGGALEFTPLNTFSTLHPMVRIDHIFVSRHFTPTQIRVPRNHLTRVASDHLPLLADLTFQEVVA